MALQTIRWSAETVENGGAEMRRSFTIGLGLALLLAFPSLGKASLEHCVLVNSNPLGVNYGDCGTTQHGGSGSVSFTNNGSTVTLVARTKRGAEEVGSVWAASLPDGTTTVCPIVHIDSLKIKGHGSVEQLLSLVYNGRATPFVTFPVDSPGTHSYCDFVPVGATGISFELITLASASKPSGHVSATETLTGVSVS